MRNLLAATAALICVTTAAASASAGVLDNFNRPDDPNSLGPNWTQQAGTSGISNNAAFGSDNSLATFNGGGGNTVSFDASLSSGDLGYVAAVIGWGSSEDYFVKIQQQDGSGFDYLGFYDGNNDSLQFQSLDTPFSAAHVTVSVVGELATLTIDPVGGAEQVYQYTYGTPYSGGGVGLGFFGSGVADNFGASLMSSVPEPATWATLILGVAMIGFAARRRRERAAVAA